MHIYNFENIRCQGTELQHFHNSKLTGDRQYVWQNPYSNMAERVIKVHEMQMSN